jgi:ribonuclease HI
LSRKFYVVWEGREKGIFTDWDTCRRQVEKFAGAKYKSYKTRTEAENAYRAGYTKPTPKSKTAPKRPRAGGPKTFSAAEIAALDVTTTIFTDGGCEPNPGKAASGLAVYRDGSVEELYYGLYNPQGTNNTAELNALHQALMMAEKEIAAGSSVAILCDSSYSIQCVTKWAVGWEKRGWKKKDGEIKNLEVIQKMYALYNKLKGKVQVLHVNGHVGVEGNELADRMSIHGIETRQEDLVQFEVPEDLKTVLKMRTG